MIHLMCVLSTMTLASADDRVWTLATSDTAITFELVNGVPVVTSLTGLADGHRWCTTPVAEPLMARAWVSEREAGLSWTFESAALDETSTTLTLTFANATPRMALRSVWRARSGPGPVEHWLEIENQSESVVTLGHQDSLVLEGLGTGAPAELRWIKRGGGNAQTQGGTFIEPLVAESQLELKSNCDDGASPVPWLAVQLGDLRGLYVGWEFSGLGRIRAEGEAGGQALRIAVGNLPDFRTDVHPGETFLVPPAFVGCYSGDIDEGSYALHQWTLRYLRPSVPTDVPDPILAYNLYLDAGGPKALEADVLRSAAFCRDLGFEAFMPDAMWFPSCGDWRWDPSRFPAGIEPIERFVHDAGMKMALWCAWTNGGISDDPAALSVRGPVGRPDWFDSDYGPDWAPGPFYGGRLCLASPEAEAWATEKTQWLVRHHHLDYLKHDIGPIVTSCNKTTHRHRYGVDASYWAATGYYRVQERLREAFPHLLLENCSGGGHIKDFGIVQRTHYTVTTDTLSNLPDRQSLYDSTFAFPPLILQAYTYEREYKVPGDDPGTFLWRSAMMGAWQIDPTNTRVWTDEERDSAMVSARIYKDWIRPMLKDVKVHHVLPRPDGLQWDGLFYWSPALRRGTFYVFRPDAAEDARKVRLKGLDAAKDYWVWSEDGGVEAGLRTGADLMDSGLSVTLPDRYTSDLVYVREATLGQPDGLVKPGSFRVGQVETSADAFRTNTRFTWDVAPGARSYRLVVADSPDAPQPWISKTVYRPAALLTGLPPERCWYWKIEAVSWGGRNWNEGGWATFATPKLEQLPGVTFVSDMDWVRATAGAGNTVHRDTNYSGQAIGVGGKSYPKGIWTHAFNDITPADVVVSLPAGRFSTFRAEAGVEDSAGAGSVQFVVLADGLVRAESPVMTPGVAHSFEVGVRGVREVTLRVLNGGDGYACDHAAWAFARFEEH